jgi:hypothetical protein
MSIQFDWHDAEDERWDRDEHDHRAAKHDWRPPDAQEQSARVAPTPAQKPKGRQVASQRTTHWETMRVVRYLGLGVLIGTVISIGVIYALALRNRAAARADLQAVITVEANALAAGDAEIFLAFQDDTDAAWQNLQKTQLDQLRRSVDPGRVHPDGRCRLGHGAVPTRGCGLSARPILPPGGRSLETHRA